MSDFVTTAIIPSSPVTFWDKMILGAYVFPGLCKLEGSVSLGVDVSKWVTNQKAITEKNPPQFVARLTDKGYDPGTIRATIEVWTSEDWDTLKLILPIFTPKTGTKIRDAYDIDHPTAALLGIKSVLVTGVSIQQPINQTVTVIMQMMQWFPTSPYKQTFSNGGGLNAVDATVPDANGNA